MYKVMTNEKWQNHLTESEYQFKSIFQVYRFITMCQHDGIDFKVNRSKK